MDFDPLTRFIIVEFYKRGITNTWDLAKKYCWADKNYENNYKSINRFYSRKNMLIKNKLNQLSKHDIISITKNSEGQAIYLLSTEKVKIKRFKFPNGIKNAILIKDTSDKWIVLEI